MLSQFNNKCYISVIKHYFSIYFKYNHLIERNL
jgi:hypothetical protein